MNANNTENRNNIERLDQIFQPMLPVGGYVAKIMDVKDEVTPNGFRRVSLRLEISEGAFAGWFQRDYELHSDGLYPAKHRGIYRVYYPVFDGSKSDMFRIHSLTRLRQVVQNSNNGFEWNPNDPKQLAGMTVGFVLRECELNGNAYIEVGKLINANAVRRNHYKTLPRKIRDDSDASVRVSCAGPVSATVTPEHLPY